MKLNDNLLRISAGYIYIDKPLELGDEVKLFVTGTVTKIEQKDCQDGTFDAVHVVKGEIAETMVKEGK